MIFLVLVMLLWVGAARQLACHLRVSKARDLHRQKAAKCRKAMAWALSLLETGEPPTGGGGTCVRRMIVEGETYMVTFTEQAEAMKYHVTVRPKLYWYERFYPLVPDSF